MDDDKAGMYVEPPSGSFSSWENTRCNPLGDMRTQTQNAWHDGYASAKVEQEWVGLTEEETIELALDAFALLDFPVEARLQLQNELVIAMNTPDSRMMLFAALIEAKLKEKNA